jgi:hypothetical protein
LRSDEAIVRIASSVTALRQASLVAGLLQLHVQDALLIFLLFPVHSVRLERGFDRHWLDRPQNLPGNRGVYPST